MKHKQKKAFTLVELIVVVTILGILSTIGFVSYSGYLSGVRDTNRISQLVALHDGLELYRTRNDLPLPDSNVEVKVNTSTAGYQGYAGKNVLETIEYSNEGKDPKLGTYFTYYLSADKRYFQLMAFLEKEESLITSTSNKAIAANDYSDLYPTIYGKKLGALTDTSNTPIQEITTIINSGALDIGSTTDTYIVHFDDNESISGTGTVLVSTARDASCKRIKEVKGSSKSGVYTIDPTGDGTGYQVYCDMTTDGGGWTMATMYTSTSPSINLFDRGNTTKITSKFDDISDKGNISDIWVDSENKDIMLQCFVDADTHKGYEEPFIIYNFLKSDIGNLTSETKAGTVFSSTTLNGKWKSLNYTLSDTWGTHGTSTTMYIVPDGSSEKLFSLKNDLGVASTHYNNSPAYTTGSSSFNNITITNYCISAIR